MSKLKAEWWLRPKTGRLTIASYPAWSIMDYFEHGGKYITIPGTAQNTIQELGIWEEE